MMADKDNEAIECAFKNLVGITERSKNLKRELKDEIFKHVSTLRNIFVKMGKTITERNDENNKLALEVSKMKEQLDFMKSRYPAVQDTYSQLHPNTSQTLPTNRENRKRYSDVLKGEEEKRYNLKIKPKQAQNIINISLCFFIKP